ncbi:MAG: hypothetical protein KAW87_06695 [Candidatus Cloacimonetes bacterium]|nr:hypothetical protein [Candidatus Cloacimonadota bacterium]
MSIRIERKIIAFYSCTMEPINPEYLSITKYKIRKYINEYQREIPDDPNYSIEDMVHDLTNSSGMYTLPFDTSKAMIEFVEELLNELVN